MTANTINREEIDYAIDVVRKVHAAFSSKIVGQENLLESLIVAIFGGGHILLESVPGLAKTTAARTVADALSADFQRIQCTPDLLPSDIIGSQIFDQVNANFKTILGPIHTNILLLDEVNRASAKTQSAMLEAMEEQQTSIAGKIYKLPDPFVVLATQNPVDQEGTYPLPEAQMDRFMIKETLRYPTAEQEVEVIMRMDQGVYNTKDYQHVATMEQVKHIQKVISRIYIAPNLLHYIARIVQGTRHPATVLPEHLAQLIKLGSGPRGTIFLVKAVRVIALTRGRTHVLPEDVAIIAPRILGHRLMLGFEAAALGVDAHQLIRTIVNNTPQQ